jgi:hypothetical protein
MRWQPYTIMPTDHVRYLQGMLLEAPPGPVLVAGSYQGGDVMAMMDVAPDRPYVVVDSFVGTGMPSKVDGNAHPAGSFSVGGKEAYAENFRKAGYTVPTLYAAYIDEHSIQTLDNDQYALIWIDLDHYAPTLAVIEGLWKCVVPGGLMLTHDFGWPSCPGIKAACDQSGLNWIDAGNTIAYVQKPLEPSK